MQTVVLLGLYPPSNVERVLIEAKRRLFRAVGTVSALALGPILPLRYAAEPGDPPDARALPHGLTLSTADWVVTDGTVMLAVEPAEQVEVLVQWFGRGTGKASRESVPVPPGAGMYIASLREAGVARHWPGGDREDSFETDDVLRLLGDPPDVTWSGSDVVCWRMHLAEPERWWDNLHCEEIWRVRLRKGGSHRV